MSPRRQPYYQHEADPPRDALETLELQNGLIADLLGKWTAGTHHLEQEGDDVNTRWERGSEVKLLLEHLAVREEAMGAVGAALRRAERDDLADQLDGDGRARREDIDALEGAVRGLSAVNLNSPDVDRAVLRVGERTRKELGDQAGLLPAVGGALGPVDRRDLPSDRNVRMHSVTRPSPEARWYDKAGPLRAVRAWYDHLRGSPHSGTSPKVDEAREYVPGPKREKKAPAQPGWPPPGQATRRDP